MVQRRTPEQSPDRTRAPSKGYRTFIGFAGSVGTLLDLAPYYGPFAEGGNIQTVYESPTSTSAPLGEGSFSETLTTSRIGGANASMRVGVNLGYPTQTTSLAVNVTPGGTVSGARPSMFAHYGFIFGGGGGSVTFREKQLYPYPMRFETFEVTTSQFAIVNFGVSTGNTNYSAGRRISTTGGVVTIQNGPFFKDPSFSADVSTPGGGNPEADFQTGSFFATLGSATRLYFNTPFNTFGSPTQYPPSERETKTHSPF